MDEKLELLFNFVLYFLLVFIIISVFFNKKRKDYSKLKNGDYVKAFIRRYDLDMKKTKYKDVLNALTIVNSLILSFSTVIMSKINGLVWKIVIPFIIIMGLIYSLYEILGRYFMRKEKEEKSI